MSQTTNKIKTSWNITILQTWLNKGNNFLNIIGSGSIFQFYYTSPSTNLLTKALIGTSSTMWTKSYDRTSSSISASTPLVYSLSWHFRVSMWKSIMLDLITFIDFGKVIWSCGMTSSSSFGSHHLIFAILAFFFF